MSTVKTTFPVESITGSLVPKGTIFRRKTFRDGSGKVIAEGDIESYIIQHPRDLSQKPYSSTEVRNHDIFREASRQTQEIMTHTLKRAEWELRWQRQLRHGEKDAPIDPRTGSHKIYKRLDAFIRACLIRELKKPQ